MREEPDPYPNTDLTTNQKAQRTACNAHRNLWPIYNAICSRERRRGQSESIGVVRCILI